MLIFINGSVNAGKTTIAKILAKKLSNTAVVEIDSLREMMVRYPFFKTEIQLINLSLT